MEPTSSLERAQLWLSQGRADRAEPELRRVLVELPGDERAHALLSLCLTQLDRAVEATEEAGRSIAAAPGRPLGHFARAAALEARGRIREARDAIDEAIRLAPRDPDAWALSGQLDLHDRKWEDAIEAAERGLVIDAEHVGCANVRARALAQLGRGDAADDAVRHTLARDPENSMTHAVAGWGRLQQGDVEGAGRHFTEALRIDPNNEAARGGLIETLKARNVFYRKMLGFFLWMSRQSKRTVWVVLIGVFVAPRILRAMARANPALEPVVFPFILLIAAFVYLTWIIGPLSDAMLFLHPLGRHALRPRERRQAQTVVALLGAGILCIVAGVFTKLVPLAIMGALGLAYVIPLSVAFNTEGRHRRKAVGAATLLGLLGVAAVVGAWIPAASIGPAGGSAPEDSSAFSMMATFIVLYLVGILLVSFLSAGWSMDSRTD